MCASRQDRQDSWSPSGSLQHAVTLEMLCTSWSLTLQTFSIFKSQQDICYIHAEEPSLWRHRSIPGSGASRQILVRKTGQRKVG